MTAQPADNRPSPGIPGSPDRREVVAIVPLAELRRLQAVEWLAPPEVVEEAEIEATLAAHREWVEMARPGEVSQEDAATELLRGP